MNVTSNGPRINVSVHFNYAREVLGALKDNVVRMCEGAVQRAAAFSRL